MSSSSQDHARSASDGQGNPALAITESDRAKLTDPTLQPPAPEFDEGYPTDEWLEALGAHDFNPWSAAVWLMEGLPAAVVGISCCGLEVEDGDYHGDPAKRLTFWTGGWSGAEALIGTMLSHFWIRHYHSKWERGGLFEFLVPLSKLSPRDGVGRDPRPTVADGDKSRDEPKDQDDA